MTYLPCLILGVLAMTAMADWQPPAIKLPGDLKHPYVAATAAELARVKAAYQANGPEHDAVASVVKNADDAMAEPIVYPPRGGQHNQWYQCDKCQVALKMIDATHHQCPKCGKIYSGEPYDDVIFSKVHDTNLNAAKNEAWAFAITGDRKYADAAGAILKGYAERYNSYPYHDNYMPAGKKLGKTGGHLYEQTLDEAMAVTWKIAPAYDLVYDALSADDRKQIEQNLIRPMLANIEKNHAGKSNWQTWHNAAFITGGAVIGDEAWVKRAIDEPKNGFLFQMNESVSKDGMWFENSWGYHFYTLQAMTAIAEGGRRIGVDLWNNPTLKSMYTIGLRYTMPDGSLPRYGDDVNTSALKQNAMMTAAAKAYGDPMLAALTRTVSFDSVLLGQPVSKEAKPKIEGSEVFPAAGHAILRTNGEAGLAAAITFGEFGGFHGHFDKLSFVFFGYGKELGVDPGRAASQAYRLPIHANWYRATVAHNAVVVDGQSQQGAEGKLLSFASNPQYAAVVTECNTAYKGIDQKRTLWLTPSYLLVVDEVSGDASQHRYDWIYHQRGTSVASPTANQDGSLPEQYIGHEYLKNIKTGTSSQQIAVDFTGDVDLRMTFRAEKNTDLLLADGVGKNVDDRVPMAMLTQKNYGARFVVVLEPVAKGKTPTVTSVDLVQPPNESAVIIVKHGDVEDRFQITDTQFLVKSAGQTVFDAKHELVK